MNGRGEAAERGRQAEAAVAGYLTQQGYQICEKNYQVHRIGELDLIAQRDGCIYIVEVKARSRSDEYGGLPQAITRQKLDKMRRTAWCYLKEKGMMNCDVSFLAALVQVESSGKINELSVLPIEWL
jgi:putative endonuclease